jgi:hypothetical protein
MGTANYLLQSRRLKMTETVQPSDAQMRAAHARKTRQALINRNDSHYVILYLTCDEMDEILTACDKHKRELLREAVKSTPKERKKMSKTIRGIMYSCLQLRQALTDSRAEELKEKEKAPTPALRSPHDVY